MAVILPFTSPQRKEWSPTEQAEFARTTSILRQTGLPVVTESGTSDEGDPWTIFLREDTGDVVVHIARIDGLVVAASAATEGVVSGASFRTVIERIIREQPLVLPTTKPSDRVFMHPSAVITAFVATALMWSYNDESDIHQYDWRAAQEANTAEPQGKSSATGSSILREALLTRAETAGLGLDSSNSSLSTRFILAASVAAVAMVADLVKSDFDDRVLAVSAEADVDGAPAEAVRQAALAAAPVDSGAGSSDLGLQQDSDQANFLFGDDRLVAAFAPAHDSGDVAVSDAGMPAVAGGTDSVISHSAEGSALGRDNAIDFGGIAHFRLGLLPLDPTNQQSSPASVQAKASSNEPAPELHPAEGVTSSGAPVASAAPAHAVAVATDASEFLSLLFSSKDLASLHISFAVDGAPAGKGTTIELGEFGQSGGLQVASASGLVAGPHNDPGYKLVDNIFDFIFDQTKEIAAAPFALQNLSTALKSNAFLPTADRILIIDVPDLRAEAFKFTDGVVMMSQELASQLLLGLEMHTQAELGLANGTTLKLIGVIDLHPDPIG